MIDTKKIGRVVQIYLEKNKLSQSALAKKAGCSEGTMSYIVHGYRSTSISVMDQVANAMGISLATLLRISQLEEKNDSKRRVPKGGKG